MAELARGTVTFLFTDVEASTQSLHDDDSTLPTRRLRVHLSGIARWRA